MSLWRREAIERFPELRREIADAEGTYIAWNALWHGLLKPAYEKEPPDTETMARVYDYAAWSLKQHSDAVRLAVADKFYQRLADDPRTWQDMPRWISQATFDSLLFAWDFYMTRQNYANRRREFIEHKSRIDNEKKTQRSASASG